MKNDKVAKESKDLVLENVEQIKKMFPEVVSEGKINLEKLKLILGQELDNREDSYTFNWAGRKDAFKSIQSTAKGTLTPSEKESVNFKQTQNIFIEGDNLEVLKLLQRSYFNKIKMIYIDPPYNTGHDFIYKDNFKNGIRAYLEQTGQLNGYGILLTTNPETSGRFHSDWISMMYPRLFLARNLLRDDGVIFVSIDDNEVHNLRMIMNEIFGEENIDTIIWRKSGDGRYGKMKNTETFRKDHEYILVAFKQEQHFNKLKEIPNFQNEYDNPDNDPRGAFKAGSISRKETASNPKHKNYYEVISPSKKRFQRQFDIPKEEFLKLDSEKRIYWGKRGDSVPAIKIFINEEREITPYSVFMNNGTTTEGTEELAELLGNESIAEDMRPKPTKLIKTLVQLATTEDCIILDFFAGSGTTAQAVIEQNIYDNGHRKFILVQLPEKTKEESEAYKNNYKTIADIAKERIRRVITKLEREEKSKLISKNFDLGFKVFKLEKSNYKIWENYEGKDIKELTKQLDLFKSPLVNGYEDYNVIYECIVKEGLNLNAKIEMRDINGNKIYKVSDENQSFHICLDEKIKQENLNKLDLKKDDLFICLDSSLDDNKKINISLQCKLKTL